MVSVSVVIVNYNGKQYIAECLGGLRKQTHKDYSIVLVDNGSVDGSLEMVRRKFPEVLTIPLDTNLGFSAANNIAFKSVKTDYVALINNDAVPHPEWLDNLVKAMGNHSEAGFVASKMLFYDQPNRIDRAGDVYTTAATAFLRGRGQPSNHYSHDEWVFGACAGAALYRKSMLDDIGLFDEEFFLLYEDVDLSFRAQLRGYKCLYVPDAVVYHKASGSIGNDTPISVYYSHRNLEWVYIQNMPASLIKKSLISHIVYDVAAFFFFVGKGRGADFIKAKWHALKGLKRILQKRRRIQTGKRVADDYIWNLFEKERVWQRLTRRIL